MAETASPGRARGRVADLDVLVVLVIHEGDSNPRAVGAEGEGENSLLPGIDPAEDASSLVSQRHDGRRLGGGEPPPVGRRGEGEIQIRRPREGPFRRRGPAFIQDPEGGVGEDADPETLRTG